MTANAVIPVLRGALLGRAERDQRARRALGDPPISAQWQAVFDVDADNTRWLAQVIAIHGWPGARLVGPDGAHAAWLIAQHALPQQRAQWLPLLQAAVKAGEASARDLAYLEDRVRTDTGLPQRYGTQWLVREGKRRLFPLDDPAVVNARRAMVNLPPLGIADITNAWPLAELPAGEKG